MENIHYSYSQLLSYYTFGILLLGGLGSLYSPKTVSAMKLFGLLGLLTFNVSSAYFELSGLPRAFPLSLPTLRVLRILLLAWLPWSILGFGADILEVRWPRIRRATLYYSSTASLLYLILLFVFSQVGLNEAELRNWLQPVEIIIYLVLAAFSIAVPIFCLQMGIRNTLSPNALRYWYKDIVTSILVCSLFQILAFIPLYLTYFPSLPNLQRYAETDFDRVLTSEAGPLHGLQKINFMPIYYLFLTIPFLIYLLYNLVQLRKTAQGLRFGSFAVGSASGTFQEGVQDASASESGGELPLIPSIFGNSAGSRINDKEYLKNFGDRYGISKREQDVLIELLQGRSYAAIGERLYISLATVKSHIYSIYRKAKVKNKIQLLGRILNE